MVVIANFLPKIHMPNKNMAMLNKAIKIFRGRPRLCWKNKPKPVVPPVIIPMGNTNRIMPRP